MSDKSINYMSTFGLATVTKVTNLIGPTIRECKRSKALMTVKLSQHYREMNNKEQLCMLMVLHDSFGGLYQSIISKLNIKPEDKVGYIERAQAGNFR